MNLDILFYVATVYVTPFWLGMIAFPNRDITKKAMSSNLFFLVLLAIYMYFVIATLDLEAAKALFNFNLSGLATFLSQEGSAGGAWVHFLVMDLFVGRWIYWQGQEKNIWTAHSLLLCLLLGPAGLLSHLVTDFFFASKNDLEKTVNDTSAT